MDGFVGEVRIFAGPYAPEGWVFCNGQLLAINSYQVLYSLIGTAYGGDGTSTFAVPDLRSRLAVSAGQAPGMTGTYPFGVAAGTATVTLDESMIPAHTHAENAVTNIGTSASPADNLYGAAAAGVAYVNNPTAANIFAADPDMVQQAGGSQPHPNTMPTLGLSYIIATAGNYPNFN